MTRQRTMPHRWLSAADAMLRGAGDVGGAAVTGGWWPKACACLIRLALEEAIDAYWRRANPAVAVCGPRRTKLLMLRGRSGPGAAVARQATYVWATLSRAVHHHCYEAPPTVVELRRLHTDVTTLLATLAPTAAGQTAAG